MDFDFRFWLWLIILVGYYVIRARNKAKKEAEERRANQQVPTTSESNSPKPLTFEDLLQEIQAGKAPARPETEQPQRPVLAERQETAPWDVDYEDAPVEEAQDLETIPPPRQEVVAETFDAYEKAKRDAFNRPSLEETMKLADTDVKFSHFKSYDMPAEKNVLASYLAELKDPEGFRKAFVLSEILKPKFQK